MKKFEDKLYNKIKGLNCISEIIRNHNSIIKQIEDIIDTIYVDISHINNFNNIINDSNIPISNIIKRKKVILNKNFVASIPRLGSDIPRRSINFINILINQDVDIHAGNDSGHLSGGI
jgi:hypothetical protein